MKKSTIILLLLTATIVYAFSEENYTQTIRGLVVDATTGFPLIGANIVLLGINSPTGTTTDLNGNFGLQNVPIGRQSIEISYIGYHKQTFNNLLLTSGKETVLNVRLEENSVSVQEIVVKATKRKDRAINDMASVSARTFSVEETERFAGSLGDPARMVANYAGVMTQNDSRNDIIIRGNSPSGVLWRMEGVEIPNPNHFGALGTTGGPVSMVNNNLLANSDFLTGAFPAEYGNATAGVFDLNLRSGNNQQREFTGQVGFNGFEFGAEGPMWSTKSGVKASYLANFRYSTMEVMEHLGFNEGTGTAIPKYKDLTFLFDLPGTKLGRFKIFGLWGKSYIEFGKEQGDSTDNSYSARGISTSFGSDLAVIGINHTYFINNKARFKSTISYQSTNATSELDSIVNYGERFNPWIRSYLTENKLSFSTQFKHKINRKNNYSLGVNADFFRINYLDSLYNRDFKRFLTYTDIKGELSLLKAYSQWQHKFSERLTGYAGLHFQYFDLNKEFVTEPRINLNWQFAPKHSLSAGFGKHSQIQPKVIYFVQSYDSVSNNYFTTNEHIRTTKSNHYIVGYNYLMNQNLRIKVETYYQQLHDIPVKESFPEFSMINAGADFAIPREDSLINEGTGSNFGIEFTIEKFLSKGYYFLFTSSLFDSKYKGFDEVKRNTAYNGNYVFNLLAGREWNFNKKNMITIDLKTVWAGGKRYIPINFNESINNGKEVRDYSKSFEKNYEDYFRADLRIGYKRNGKRISQEWALDLQNITNYKSIFAEGMDLQKGETYKIYQQGFMPMMLYRIQF